ncbi:ABC transporter substrate-binding protein [Microvirga aerophila]|nr:extracellular solute-binding protein [Microvirga aerophila]
MAEIAKSWGINFQVRFVTTDQLEKKVVVDYTGGAETWDLVYTGGVQRMFDWADGGIVKEMTPFVKEHGDPKLWDWEGLTESARKAVSHGDKILGLAVATSDQTLAYRRDLFENPDEKAAFKAKYGYDLVPPDTYKQFRDVAEFFTRKKGEKLAGVTLDQDVYGTAYSNKKGTFLWHDYENVLLAFGVDLYDPKTGKVGLTSPESVEAANYYKSLVPFQPESHINMSSGEVSTMFANGQLAMYIEYFDRVVSTVAKDAKIKPDQIGYVFPPTQEGNPKGRVHAFRSGPAVIAIFGRATNAEAAFKLLEAAASTESQIEMARKHPGYMPTRKTALEKLIADQPEVDYLRRVSTSKIDALTDAEIMPYPLILKASEIGDAISEAAAAILIGAPVESELAKAQAKVEKEAKSLNK